jgi:deoxyguanosine kinase
MNQWHYIAVEGGIGAGKTSLVKMLGEEMNARCIYENSQKNPFLPDFYRDPGKYAFQTQLFFLVNRYSQQMEIQQQDLFSQVTLCDYLFEKDRIFANLTLNAKEIALYEQIYGLLVKRVPTPDLVIYLQARPQVLLERIRKRGIEYEQKISLRYLEKLCEAYNEYFFHYEASSLLVVDTSEMNFVEQSEDLEALKKEIWSMKRGTQYFRTLGASG